jgi:hypothetical protein
MYPLKTLSGSTDIAGIENISIAMRDIVEYSFAFSLHHSSKSNSSSSFKMSNAAFKYLVNSFFFLSDAPNRQLLISNVGFAFFESSGTGAETDIFS